MRGVVFYMDNSTGALYTREEAYNMWLDRIGGEINVDYGRFLDAFTPMLTHDTITT